MGVCEGSSWAGHRAAHAPAGAPVPRRRVPRGRGILALECGNPSLLACIRPVRARQDSGVHRRAGAGATAAIGRATALGRGRLQERLRARSRAIRHRSEELTRLERRLTRAGVAVSCRDAHGRRQSGHAVAAEQSLVHVALGREQDSVPAGVCPVERILAGVCATGAQHGVGRPRARSCPTPVAAHEHHDRRSFHASSVAARVQRPAGQEMVVALEPRGRETERRPIVEVDDQIDRRRLRLACSDIRPAGGRARAKRRSAAGGGPPSGSAP